MTSGLSAQPCLRGINAAGGEFGPLPGKHGKTHIFPSDATLDYFASKGMNVIRLPFRWERVQPQLYGELDDDELERIKDTVRRATARGMTTILDPHNYAKYAGTRMGQGRVLPPAFADFWLRFTPHFANRDDVIFLLMNEPAGISAATWLPAANAGIEAIRKAGANNLIMVPGTIWTGASHWFDDQDGGSNAEVLREIHDPQNHFIFEVHQYLDRDYSGTNTTCPRVDDAILALEGVSGWFRQHGYAGFVGEFGGSSSPDCLAGIAEMASYLNSQGDIWLGWTAWAGGDWWGDYPLSLQPKDGNDRPQMKALEPHIRTPDGRIAQCLVSE
ncbi:glycoside hydrolase family 5 protein [Roseibium sp.]|uniref:glycoside hydrolase family 5 protein n=1 Tax=Roseibium sp. TaxID=1936156 RepID=UPI003A977235